MQLGLTGAATSGILACGGWRQGSKLATTLIRTTSHHPSRIQSRLFSLESLDKEKGDRERVVILGSGWAGYGLARSLDPNYFQTVIVTPRTYFVFTPLLASTAVGTLEFRNAIESTRLIPGSSVIRGWAEDVDMKDKKLTIQSAVERRLRDYGSAGEVERGKATGYDLVGGEKLQVSWDKMVVAVGSFSQTFNIPGVKEYAYFLKDITDARAIRRRLLECFEEAALPTAPEERKRQLLHFAIVGGGPTGVEFGAELNDLITEDLNRIYPWLKDYVKITIFDVAPRILTAFDEKLGKYAEKVFRRSNIEVLTNHAVEKIMPGFIHTKEEGAIPVGMVVWSTGLKANPFVTNYLSKPFEVSGEDRKGEWELVKNPRTKGLQVDNHLRTLLKSRTDENMVIPSDALYAIGDCANLPNPLPATAQVANQEAQYLAGVLNNAAKREKKQKYVTNPVVTVDKEKPFQFKNLGIMAYLGSWRAISDFGRKGGLSGYSAWVLWRTAYLTKSQSWKNRFLISCQWFINWAIGRDINRF